MKSFVPLFLLFSFSLYAEPLIFSQDEEAVLSELVEATKKNLSDQQALLKSIQDFNRKKEAFLLEPTSAKLATTLVKAAMRLEKQIEESQLISLLSADFLTEIHFFSKVGKEVKQKT